MLRCSSAVLLAFSGFPGSLVHAQSANDRDSATAEETSTIVVTARRREELLQDVPAAVSAFSGAALEKIGIPDIVGLTDLVPNTTLKTSRATNTTLTAFIRGVGQQDPVAGYEQGVGVYLDDIYLARPQGAILDIYDVDRIEVLRGPQGTLYGRNTIGGAVKYVTRRLGPNPEVRAKMTYGSFGETDLVVTGSQPLSDTFRIGGTIASLTRDGFGTNVVTGAENYNKKVLAGRISAEFLPTSSVFVRFAADRTVDDSSPRAGYRLTPGPAGETVLENQYDTRAGLYSVLGHAQQVVTHGESLLVNWELDPLLSFKSITATRGSTSNAPIDFDSLMPKYFEAPAIYSDRQFSQEFQFTYTGAKLQGVAGVYFMSANARSEFDAILPNSGGLSLYTLADVDTRTWAAFADGSYSLSDTWSANFGGRFTNDQRKARVFKATYLGSLGSPTLGNPAAVRFGVADTDMSKDNLQRTDTKFTPKIGLGLKLNPRHNMYVSYSEGFKGGMFDPRMSLGGNPTSPAALAKRAGVKPEEIGTYELGLKSKFDGGRTQTNVAVFSSDYRNVQIPGSLLIDTNGDGVADSFVGTLTNAGKAKVSGIELEAIARLTEAFSVSAMLGYIDAKYKEWTVNQAGALVNVAANKNFQNTPKTTANLTATYEWPMAMFGRGGRFSLANSLSYKSKTFQFEDPLPLIDQDAYSVWDASLVWTSSDRKLSAGLYGRNLTDKRYKVAGYNFAGFSNTITTFFGDPRTVKATVELRF